MLPDYNLDLNLSRVDWEEDSSYNDSFSFVSYQEENIRNVKPVDLLLKNAASNIEDMNISQISNRGKKKKRYKENLRLRKLQNGDSSTTEISTSSTAEDTKKKDVSSTAEDTKEKDTSSAEEDTKKKDTSSAEEDSKKKDTKKKVIDHQGPIVAA